MDTENPGEIVMWVEIKIYKVKTHKKWRSQRFGQLGGGVKDIELGLIECTTPEAKTHMDR